MAPPPPENLDAAAAAGLRYVHPDEPGLSRRRAGRGFTYHDVDGRRITDQAVLARIRTIAIPPAWTHVWICRSSRGHIQATGRDAKGRKQYRYHERWRSTRDETKFGSLEGFGLALPRIRRRLRRDLRLPGLPREKVIAASVSLLDRTFARIGNESYARENGSFGITTLRDRHVAVRGSTITIAFTGKSGREHELELDDAKLARIVRRCQDLPGQRLFQYLDGDGARQPIGSHDINAYLREATGEDFTAKDFRTWAGTVRMARALRDAGPAASERARARAVKEAVTEVAAALGNTPAVCRASYVHPVLIERYTDERFDELWEACEDARRSGLRRDEAIVLAMLKRARRARGRGAASPARAA